MPLEKRVENLEKVAPELHQENDRLPAFIFIMPNDAPRKPTETEIVEARKAHKVFLQWDGQSFVNFETVPARK